MILFGIKEYFFLEIIFIKVCVLIICESGVISGGYFKFVFILGILVKIFLYLFCKFCFVNWFNKFDNILLGIW